jgi:hypothetical protein
VNINIFKSISYNYDFKFLHNMWLQTYNNISVQQASITTVTNKNISFTFVISSFHHGVNVSFTLPGCYAVLISS